jgi:hypothetical protein
MKCEACQHLLLTIARPDEPPGEAAQHLAECPACQEWHRQLLRIESNVHRIPVPHSRGRERLLQKILEVEPSQPWPTAPATVPLRRRSRWHVTALGAAGLVAAAVLIACGIFLGNVLSRSLRPAAEPSPLAKGPLPKTPADKHQEEKMPAGQAPASPLLARLLAHDLDLAEARTPRQRVETLAALADELKEETSALAQVAGPDDLRDLARLYRKVVREGVVARAHSLPASQRRAVLEPIAERLQRTGRDFHQLARASRQAGDPLRQIADAATDGDSSLRNLMKEATP